MVKKQIWNERLGQWQERNLSANRIAIDTIKRNFGRRKFNLSEMQQALGVDRKTAWNWLYLLRKWGYVNSKAESPRRNLDNRWYKLNNKGAKKMPRKKGIVKSPEVKTIVKEVPVIKENLVEYEDKFVETWRKK